MEGVTEELGDLKLDGTPNEPDGEAEEGTANEAAAGNEGGHTIMGGEAGDADSKDTEGTTDAPGSGGVEEHATAPAAQEALPDSSLSPEPAGSDEEREGQKDSHAGHASDREDTPAAAAALPAGFTLYSCLQKLFAEEELLGDNQYALFSVPLWVPLVRIHCAFGHVRKQPCEPCVWHNMASVCSSLGQGSQGRRTCWYPLRPYIFILFSAWSPLLTRYLCEHCNRRRGRGKDGEKAVYCDARKRIAVSKLPHVLTLHLKRFEQIGHGQGLRKISRHVPFPLELSMAPFCKYVTQGECSVCVRRQGLFSGCGRLVDLMLDWFASLVYGARSSPTGTVHVVVLTLCRLHIFAHRRDCTLPDGMQAHGPTTPGLRFRLYGIVEHSGSLRGGHYTAYVRLGDKEWAYASDGHISRVQEERVKSASASLLFYEYI